MKDYPLISIVTPSFNQGKYIEETILSVLNQSYKNVELIIIDGGSCDDTVEIIKKYGDQIHYWVSEKDDGQAHAIIKGLEKCRGEIFNWINSDDKLAENSLSRIAEIYLKNNKPDLIAGNIIRFDEAGNKILHLHTNYWNNVARTMGMGQMCQPGMFYKTTAVRKIGLNGGLHFSMDIDLFFRFNLLLEDSNAVYVNEKFAEFRIHQTSKTTVDNEKKESSSFFAERIKIISFFIESFNDVKSARKMKSFFPQIEKSKQAISFTSANKRSLLGNVVDYFLLEQLFVALHAFDKKKICLYMFKINWFRIQPSLIGKVLKKLFCHFILFLRNRPRKIFYKTA